MTYYEKLKGIVDEIDDLISQQVRSSEPVFQAWRMKAERFLIKKYGKDSLEYKTFCKTYFSPLLWRGTDMKQENKVAIEYCSEGLRSCKAIFNTYLEDMADENNSVSKITPKTKAENMDKIFIVHGHDGELKQSVARLIEQQGIEAIILSEQANQGRTIIEKFERYSDVSGAICLFTADDFGRSKSETQDRARARQNVVFETGYFIGKLGRSNVVIIADNDVEIPSDLSGVVYTNKNNWQLELIKELKAMGYNVDANKLL